MLLASSAPLPRVSVRKCPGQSSVLSPQRKKARRVSDPLDTVVRQQQAKPVRPSSSAVSQPQPIQTPSNPLSLLCFALENAMDNKENIPPTAVKGPATKKKGTATTKAVMKAATPEIVVSKTAVVTLSSRTFMPVNHLTQATLDSHASPLYYHTNLDFHLTEKGPKPKRNYQPWHVRYQELLAYKTTYGNCRVPQKSLTYPSLARWVVYMRAQYKAGKLTNEKIARLEAAGFEWCADNSRYVEWNEKLKELARFKRDNGHLNVLQHQNPALHYWCYMQRCKRDDMSMDCLLKLDKLGFDWGIYFDTALQPVPTGGTFETDKLLVELQIYYRTHGHVQIPSRFPPSPALAQWAYRVAKNDLDAEQVALMNSLGFIWRNEPRVQVKSEAGSMTNHTYLPYMSTQPV